MITIKKGAFAFYTLCLVVLCVSLGMGQGRFYYTGKPLSTDELKSNVVYHVETQGSGPMYILSYPIDEKTRRHVFAMVQELHYGWKDFCVVNGTPVEVIPTVVVPTQPPR